jgi:hypothetical protein
VIVEERTYQEAADEMRKPLSTIKRWGRVGIATLRGALLRFFGIE